MSTNSNFNNKAILLGGLLISAGVLLVLDNFNFFPFGLPSYIFSWPMLLIIVGVVNLISNNNKVPGLIILGIGCYFLLPQVLDIPHNQFHLLWPLLLIIAGLALIVKRNHHHNHDGFKNCKTYTKTDSNLIDETALFGGGEKEITSPDFKGGKVTAIFGGMELNLLNSKLAEGTNVIELTAIFGGVSFIVPADWNVRAEITPLFGGFTQKRHHYGDVQIDTSKELLIKGTVIFGGGEIKFNKY